MRMLGALALALALLAGPTGASQVRSEAADGEAALDYARGEALRLGKGVPVDREAAIGWYKRAAAHGHVGAQDALGVMLFTKGERKTAIPLLQAAARRGDPRALYILGTAHFNGDAVPRDYPRAYAEMKRAAAAGLPEAQRNLARMEGYLTPDDRAKAVAILAGRDVPDAAPPPVAPNPSLIAPSPAPPAAPIAGPVIAPSPPQPRFAALLPAPPAAALPIRPVLPSAVPPTAVMPAPVAGGWRVQLGAYGTAAQAENQWAVLVGRVSGMAPLPHTVSHAGAFWRLQASGIGGKAAADALCRSVAAAGGACFAIAP